MREIASKGMVEERECSEEDTTCDSSLAWACLLSMALPSCDLSTLEHFAVVMLQCMV